MTGRVQAVRKALAATECDALVSLSQPENQYLAGFSGSTSAVVVTAEKALFLCDFRYTEQAGEQVGGFDVEEIDGELCARAGERIRDLGVEAAGFDPARLTVDQLNCIQEEFQRQLIPIPDIVGNLRRVKSPEETGAIREASELAEDVLADVLGTLAPGITERELAAWFEYEFKRRGASGAAFDTIALFGPRTSLPHGAPGERPLRIGDIILLDFGCRKGGYCSDLTRTYAYGTISDAWFEEIYELVLTAQKVAVEAVRPGVTCRELDSVARSLISEAGYGDRFGHGLGHGVGIEIHESPTVNKDSETVLEVGMALTIEPGVYLPGRGGVRIEDLVVVTEDGCEVLSTAPKELTVLTV